MSSYWNDVIEVCERRAWLLEEMQEGRVSYDDLTHKDNCNVNPLYHKGNPEVLRRGCDCGAVQTWKREHEPH